MTSLSQTLSELAAEYCALHSRKEDAFWIAKMGLADDPVSARNEAAGSEKAWNAFLQSPQRLSELRRLADDQASEARQRTVLDGWIAMLSAHTIESAEGRKRSAELVELEAELERQRVGMKLGYVDPDTGAFVAASTNRLTLLTRTSSDARLRRAAYDGIRSIEQFVLDHGFLDIVKKRNALARLLGHEDYYAWKVETVERMSKARLFSILEDLAQRTAEGTRASLASFAAQHGEDALQPFNFPYLRSGDLTEKLDPYFGFAPALERWVRSFFALGVRFRGATLTLDLLDRAGKYENGFMHGPEPAFVDDGTWRPARINFTANAVVGQVGSGMRALQTLFHEGGHAAHFANIVGDAPCFSQEFAPTSVAYAEAQSMFMDSLIDDADWRRRYARDENGEPMPTELIEASIREEQPFRGWEQRMMLTVPFAERALYELPDDELTPDRVLSTFREIERDLQGLDGGIRPILAVPHLLSGEASAYYHGYVLAEMAVCQMREHFLTRDGKLTDNDRIGPELADACWAPGNALPFDDILSNLTGSPLSADALVDSCNRPTDEVVASARTAAGRVGDAPQPAAEVELDGTIVVMHGRQTVCDTAQQGYEAAFASFSEFIRGEERSAD